MINILITDDHTLIRETWNFIFSSDPRFNVIGVVGTGEEAIELAEKHSPDVVLMDINLPGMTGIQATEGILEVSPKSKVLAVSMHGEPSYAKSMMKKGAMGY